jgi:phosphatidylinositol alpha-1,6-mannosyltransferase
VRIPDLPSPEQQLAARQEFGLGEETPVILSVCRLLLWKHVDRIVGGMPDVLRQLPDAKLVIVGDGPEQDSLEGQARELGIRDRVIFAGRRPRSQTAALLAGSDVFVSVYDYSNVGNALLEAMAMGCCVVAFDSGRTREVVLDGRTGRLLRAEDLPALGRHCAELLADADLRKRLGDGARAFIRDEVWRWEERTDREVAAIEKLPRFHRRLQRP